MLSFPRRSAAPTGWLAIGLAVLIQAGCETPPDNTARFWNGRDVQAPDAAASMSTAMPDPEGDPILGAGGEGGFASAGEGGAGGAAGGSTGGNAGGGAGGAGGPSTGGAGGVSTGGNTGKADAAVLPADAGTGPVNTGTGCSVAVKVTTTTTGSDYAPDNIGAVWIADAQGKFVKSLEVWANRRMTHLNRWVAATTAAGRDRDTVDAVTSATASKHLTHSSTWNCTAAAGGMVPRGTYQLCMEMNESNDASIAYQCVKFDNAGVAFKAMPADASYFKARVIDYAPR